MQNTQEKEKMMATQRTKQYLQETSFADNTAGDIGADDARDLVETLFGTWQQPFIPNTDETHDIGSSSYGWKNGYFQTITTDAITSRTNEDLVIAPNGTGALVARAGGNARGDSAVDLQMIPGTGPYVASGNYSTIGGGIVNIASGDNSTVSGGYSNIASGGDAVISGGHGNLASGADSTIAGGDNNVASGTHSAISGGYGNHATGAHSTVAGGYSNNATSSLATIAGGMGAYARLYGQQSYAAGGFNVQMSGNAQTSLLVTRNITTTASEIELYLDGYNERMTLPTDTTWMFEASIVARRTDADNESAAYKITGCIDNNAGTTALVGTPTTTVIAEDQAAWDVSVEADDANDALVIKVTGENSKTIYWVARIELVEVTG